MRLKRSKSSKLISDDAEDFDIKINQGTCYEKLYCVTFKRDIPEASREFRVCLFLVPCANVPKVYFVIFLYLDFLEVLEYYCTCIHVSESSASEVLTLLD